MIRLDGIVLEENSSIVFVNNTENYFSDNDVYKMTDAICSLLEDQQKASDLTLNARHFIEQMDWNVVKEEWKRVLR